MKTTPLILIFTMLVSWITLNHLNHDGRVPLSIIQVVAQWSLFIMVFVVIIYIFEIHLNKKWPKLFFFIDLIYSLFICIMIYSFSLQSRILSPRDFSHAPSDIKSLFHADEEK